MEIKSIGQIKEAISNLSFTAEGIWGITCNHYVTSIASIRTTWAIKEQKRNLHLFLKYTWWSSYTFTHKSFIPIPQLHLLGSKIMPRLQINPIGKMSIAKHINAK